LALEPGRGSNPRVVKLLVGILLLLELEFEAEEFPEG
jgi:hypothetical protein